MYGLFINEDKHSSNVGCRWTDKCVCKIIKLLEIKRHFKDNYDKYFKQNTSPIIDLLQVSLCS